MYALGVNTWLRRTSSTLFMPSGWGVSLNRGTEVPKKNKNRIEINQEREIQEDPHCFGLFFSHWGCHFSVSRVADFLFAFLTFLSFSFSCFVSPPLHLSRFFVLCLFFSFICGKSQTAISSITCPFNASKILNHYFLFTISYFQWLNFYFFPFFMIKFIERIFFPFH